MSIVKIKDKRLGVTYVYEQEKSVWNPEKKQARSTRKLIGKIDPATGKIIPTKGWGHNRKYTSSGERDYKALYAELVDENASLRRENAELLLRLASCVKDGGAVGE